MSHLQLILREIRVKHFDPSAEPKPKEKGLFDVKIRTKWYLVNVSLFASDLFPEGYKFGEISSEFVRIGSAGKGGIRTSWDLSLTLGIPFSRWGASPFVCAPVSFPADIVEEVVGEQEEETEAHERRPHPLELALTWRQQMDEDPKLNKAKIAAREGISRARVTQIMDLLELPAEIQNCVLCPPVPLESHLFPERQLRLLVRCENEEAQISRWQEMLEELGIPVGQWTKI